MSQKKAKDFESMARACLDKIAHISVLEKAIADSPSRYPYAFNAANGFG
jgi:hypothetical protein